MNFGAIEDYLAEPNLRLLKMHNLRQSPMRLKGYVFHDLYHITLQKRMAGWEGTSVV